MNLPLTYGQCLRKIMQQNQLSVNTLSRKMGYRSATQLTRILSDEVSPSLITKFHHQFMLIFDWLISPAQIRELSTSLQYSCLGHDAFLTRRAMHRMLLSPVRQSLDAIPVHVHPEETTRMHTLSDLFELARTHESVDMLVLGSQYDTLLPMFAELINQPSQAGRMRIRHVFVMEEQPSQLISQISALVPYLNMPAYSGAYCTQASPEICRLIQSNPVAISRSRTPDGRVITTLLTPPQKGGVSVCRLMDSDTLFTFYEQMLSSYVDHLRPIKSVYPWPKTVENLLTLCERDLFLEQNRSCCFVRLDFPFPVLPEEIVLSAVGQGECMGLAPDDPLMMELRRVHRARCAHMMNPSVPVTLILSLPAIEEFMRTGHVSDHLFAMRNFTPEERRAILGGFIQAAKASEHLHVHVFADEKTAPIGCFTCYDGMGVQISANNTAYNIGENHSEVFVGLPAFADTFSAYCKNTLIPELCLDEKETLRRLRALLDAADALPTA